MNYEKIDVGGIKLSRELVQFNWTENTGVIVPGWQFIKMLAENKVNIPFMCIGTGGGKISSFCCIEADSYEKVQILLEKAPQLTRFFRIINAVGTLTVFPHRNNYKLLGRVTEELGKAGIPIYGMGTSMSALTFSTDFDALDRAVKILSESLDLPPAHAPFRSRLRVKQI